MSVGIGCADLARDSAAFGACRWHWPFVLAIAPSAEPNGRCGAARYESGVEAAGVTVLVAKRADARKCHAARQAPAACAILPQCLCCVVQMRASTAMAGAPTRCMFTEERVLHVHPRVGGGVR